MMNLYNSRNFNSFSRSIVARPQAANLILSNNLDFPPVR